MFRRKPLSPFKYVEDAPIAGWNHGLESPCSAVLLGEQKSEYIGSSREWEGKRRRLALATCWRLLHFAKDEWACNWSRALPSPGAGPCSGRIRADFGPHSCCKQLSRASTSHLLLWVNASSRKTDELACVIATALVCGAFLFRNDRISIAYTNRHKATVKISCPIC